MVISLGRDVPIFDDHDLAPGDQVLFTSLQEETFWYNTQEYIILEYNSVLGVIDDERRLE